MSELTQAQIDAILSFSSDASCDDLLTQDQSKFISDCSNEIEDILTFKNCTEGTIQAYKTYTIPFMRYCYLVLGKSPDKADERDVRQYFRTMQASRHISDRTVNAALSHLKFLFEAILDSRWNPKKVPFKTLIEYVAFMPTEAEVEQLINSIRDDPEKRCMVIIMYGCGLRISEVCRLRFGDIYSKDHRIYVSPSKRSHDRYVELPDTVLAAIREYARTLPKELRMDSGQWLFPRKRDPSQCVYPQFLQKQLRKYEGSLGWEHRFTCHTFRRAYATHNVTSGNQTMEEMQINLGHKKASTTQLYVLKGTRGLALAKPHKNSIDTMNILKE